MITVKGKLGVVNVEASGTGKVFLKGKVEKVHVKLAGLGQVLVDADNGK